MERWRVVWVDTPSYFALEWREKNGCQGKGKKNPTVGRSTDLPWVGETTYSRFFRRPTVGRFLGSLEGAF